jgi:hypothetical protein
MRVREKGDHDLVDRLRPIMRRVQQIGELAGPRLPIRRRRKADHAGGDLARPPAGKPHYAKSTSPGRRGNGDDGVG